MAGLLGHGYHLEEQKKIHSGHKQSCCKCSEEPLQISSHSPRSHTVSIFRSLFFILKSCGVALHDLLSKELSRLSRKEHI